MNYYMLAVKKGNEKHLLNIDTFGMLKSGICQLRNATKTESFPALTDSSHERAGGNLRYYENLLHKQLSELNQDYEPASEEPIQLGTYSRPKDHLPEREAYEALCRGEGLQMVRHFQLS